VGYLFGSPIFGYIGDTYGRRTVRIVTLFLIYLHATSESDTSRYNLFIAGMTVSVQDIITQRQRRVR